MIKPLTILFVCLLAFSYTQTCGESNVPFMQTGLVELGLPTTSFAQKQYTVTFKKQLGVFAEVFYAFAIAGFQGSCTQDYFSLVVDRVDMQNKNTKMSFQMDYNYGINSTNYESQWTKVKLTWIVVTNQFQSYNSASGGSFVWAGTVDVAVNNIGSYGLFGNSSIFANTTNVANTCGYLGKLPNNNSPKFDKDCIDADQIVAHYYIMGFKYNPAGASNKLAVSALFQNYFTNANVMNSWGSGANGFGPIVNLNNYGGALKRIKVSFVLTTLIGYNTYPGENGQIFGYSGLYMPITLKNKDRPIIKGQLSLGQYGYNYQKYNLPKVTHQIYGLSSFTISSTTQCSGLDVDLQIKDFYTALLQTDNTDSLNNIFISADFYSKNTLGLCSNSTTPSRTMNQITNLTSRTVPDFKINQQNLKQTSSNPLEWSLLAEKLTDGSKTITYQMIMNYENFVVGNTYKFISTLQADNSFNTYFSAGSSKSIRWTIQVNGQIMSDKNIVDFTLGQLQVTFGLAIQTKTPRVKITVTVPRVDLTSVEESYDFQSIVRLVIEQYKTVYNPATDCCVDKCPSGSAINLITSPPSCVLCQNNSGLVFDSVIGTCSCKVGYYNILQSENSGKYVCFPCLANLCATCTAANSTTCATCVVGAEFDNATKTCKCMSGFYQNAGQCTICPAKCATCSLKGVCNTCSTPSIRLIANNCDCPVGLYDDGTSICKTCNPICKTCNSSTTCTSCFTQNNRTLINGQCVCASGFFQIINPNNTFSCRKCSPQCKQCSSLNTCIDCNSQQNRISGYDQLGRLTCLCMPGFISTKDNLCVQSGCTADPFCQVCDTSRGVSICIQCLASSKRVLAIPQYACVCQQGFYESKGQCVQCPSGCAKCSNGTICELCAVQAVSNNNGTCSCLDGKYFVSQPIRSCKNCSQYCVKCSNGTSCDLCLPGFTYDTISQQCACNRGKYVNAMTLQCMNCMSNCSVCLSDTNCSLCFSGYYLQDNVCVLRCSQGYYTSGAVCQKCQQGCMFCQRAGACLVCQVGRYSYNGLCYVNCPAGSIVDSTNQICVACNSPCKTCVQHPSKCLSCLTGFYFFENVCQNSCRIGTWNNNGVCQYCSFECVSCLGSANVCISCPNNQFLFQGNCYSKCPVPLVNGRCPNVCPNGFYMSNTTNSCLKCSDRCRTCRDSADYCLNCISGVANNGQCISSCPSNRINVNGNCLACAQGCNTCNNTVQNCLTCASGYFLSNNKCLASCPSDSFRDVNNNNLCVKCQSTCKTCSSANFCTSCVQPRSQPINGVCYSCIYPCSNCTQYQKCASCLNGFNLYDSRCVSSCPLGSTTINGVCRCNSGFFLNGRCVSNCGSGFTAINENCVQCSSECAECSGSINQCTKCKSGFVLNSVTGICQASANCQYGEYFSTQERRCKRICPSGTSFQDSVCLTECLQGFIDNKFGGCIQQGIVSGCSYPYFYQQGICVSTCVAGTYPNSITRVCQPCSSNCFSCLSSAFCTSCRSGFDLNNNICITGSRCTNNRFKYNGICVDSCPVGSLPVNGYCERRCDPNFYFNNGKCYSICPANLLYRTDVACVSSCPIGFILDGKICKLNSQSCPSGQFYNNQNGLCSSCLSPCSQCQYTNAYCNSCPPGYILSSNKCVQSNNLCSSGLYRAPNGQCTQCPSKCLQCVSSTDCLTCSYGYVFNGRDCILKTSNLKQIQLTQSYLYRRDKTLFISIKLSIIPNGLSNDQKNGFFIVIPSANDRVLFVNQWISLTEPNTVMVAVQYQVYPQLSTVFLTLNSAILSSSFANVGYTATQNSFLSILVTNSIGVAPSTLSIPPTVTNSMANKENDVLAAQIPLKKAINQGRQILKN